MRTEFSSAIILILISAFLVAGCSGNPASPNVSGPDIPGFTNDSYGQDDSGHMCLGYYSILLDTESAEVDIVPVRSGNLHLNLVNVLNSTMGVSAKPVLGECDPLTGLFVMDITLSHPFATKSQFAGFDVKGILITPGTLSVPPLIFADTDETNLENADGFTRWWNPTEFTSPGIFGYVQGKLANEPASGLTATVNPYKLFADILGATDILDLATIEPTGNDGGRAVFRAGSINTRRYEIRFPLDPGPIIRFGYAIDCSWAAPSPNPPSEVPDNFPIQANQPEAYRVELKETVNTLYYDSEPGIGGGVLRLTIDVYDWQGQIGGNIPSQIAAVKIFSPDLGINSKNATLQDSNPIKATYSANFAGSAIPTHAGDVKLICKIESNDGSTYKQGAQPAPTSPLSAYQVITLDIPDPVCVGDANNDWIDAVELDFDSQIANQVCLPDDYRDFYSLEIPLGSVASGIITLWCDASLTKLEIYDSDQVLVDKKDVSGGLASFSFDDLDLMPDNYYFRVYTANDIQVAPYLLELIGNLLSVTPSNVQDVTPPNLFLRPFHIWLYNHYAYMLGLGHWVYDLTEPDNPVYVGGDLVGDIWTETPASFNPPYCYYVQGLSSGPPYDQINLVDFTNPASPMRSEGVLAPGPEITAMCMNSTYIYIATDEDPDPRLTVYHYLEDPLNPADVGSVALPAIADTMDLLYPEGSNTQVVIGAGNNLYTYSVESPLSITPTGGVSLYPTFECNDLATYGDYICIADMGGSENGFVDIYRFTNPGLELTSFIATYGQASAICLVWPYAYIADGTWDLTTVDLTDPSSPVSYPGGPTQFDAFGVAADNEKICVIPESSAPYIYDRVLPSNPEYLTHFLSINSPEDKIYFENDYMIVGDRTAPSSIEILDISNPAETEIVGENPMPIPVYHMAKDGNTIVIGSDSIFQVVDCTDLFAMEAQGTWDLGLNLIDRIAVRGHVAYVGTVSAGTCIIRILNITDPWSPDYVNTISYSGFWIGDIEFYGDTMYIATEDGVRIYGNAASTTPEYISTYSTTDDVIELEVVGDRLYIYMAGISMIEIADISAPLTPVHIGLGSNGASSSQDMAIDGQFAYFSGNDPWIRAAWIYPPETPSEYGSVYPDKWAGAALYANDGYLYKITLGTGLRIFDLYE